MAFSDYNLGGLRTRVKFRLQNDPRYTSAMVDLALKKAVVELMLYVRNTTSIFNASTYVLTAGADVGKYAMEYPLHDNTLWVDSLSFDGQPALNIMDQIELANTGIQQNSGIGDPRNFYVYDTPERIKIVVLWPRPGRVATLEFWGGVEPLWQVNGDSSVPPFREDYSEPLESYARAYLIDGQEGQEVNYAFILKKWKEERSEAKFNQRVNRVSRTRRTRDVP